MSDDSKTNNPPLNKLIARLSSAHGVYDVNAVAWCPRKGYEGLMATAGDDGVVRVWRISPS
jgi:WD40 repeat protein